MRRALHQHPAADHHDDARGEAEHQLHVVLDEQHGDVAREAGDGGEQFRALLARHAGRRLVEQQHLRPGRQRQRDFEKALLAVGQFARRAVANRAELQRGENVVSLVDLVAVGVELPPPDARGAACARIPQASPISSAVRCGNSELI